MEVSFRGIYRGTEENKISQVSFSDKNGNIFYSSDNRGRGFNFNEIITVDLIECINLFGPTKASVKLIVKDLYGTE